MWLLYARIVVKVVVLSLKIFGVPLCFDGSTIAQTITKTEEAIRGSPRFQEVLRVFLDAWRQAGDCSSKRAQAIFNLLLAINAEGFLWMIIKSLFSSMAWWAWMKTSALVSATIALHFGSGGLSFIANIALKVNKAIELIADISEAVRLL